MGSLTFLSNDEVAQLTGRRRRKLQIEVLRTMGIEHRRRPDGSLAVLRSHVDRIFGAAPNSAKVKEYSFGEIKRATPTQT